MTLQEKFLDGLQDFVQNINESAENPHNVHHRYFSNDEATKRLQNDLKNPQFNEWNFTSICHIYVYLTGRYGTEKQLLAKEIANNFINWLQENNIDSTVAQMKFDSADCIYEFAKEYNFTQDEIGTLVQIIGCKQKPFSQGYYTK